MFRRTDVQSLSVWSRGLPRYQNVVKFSTIYYSSTPYRLNSIYQYITAISTSLRRSILSVALWHLSDCLWLKSLAAGMCILHWSHRGNSSGTSCMMSTFNFKCPYMKCSPSIHGVFSLSGNLSTGNSTNFIIRRNYNIYISSPPPPTSTPLTWGSTISCELSIWCRREEAVIVPPQSLQLTLVLLLYQKVGPYPVALRLHSSTTCWTQMNPGVHIIALVFLRFVCTPTLSKILTMAANTVCTHIGLCPTICPSFA